MHHLEVSLEVINILMQVYLLIKDLLLRLELLPKLLPTGLLVSNDRAHLIALSIVILIGSESQLLHDGLFEEVLYRLAYSITYLILAATVFIEV
jgi:hypothetical protein